MVAHRTAISLSLSVAWVDNGVAEREKGGGRGGQKDETDTDGLYGVREVMWDVIERLRDATTTATKNGHIIQIRAVR